MSMYPRLPFALLCSALLSTPLHGQLVSDTIQAIQAIESLTVSEADLSMDAVYNRPVSQKTTNQMAMGGYLEINSLVSNLDGLVEGPTMQARRMTLFMASSISSRLKFLSEVEFEEGGHEINIEFAAVDLTLHPLLTIRAGIITNPIGSFNQNHDGPKWHFIERPDMASSLLPATWSNAGMGVHGKAGSGKWLFGYEAYLSSGFDASIIDNTMSRTYLPAAKANANRFEEGEHLLFTGKLVLKHPLVGEWGLSMMTGAYNDWKLEGMMVDDKRLVKVLALDWHLRMSRGTDIRAELASIAVDVPSSYGQQYGSQQSGVFIDVVQPLFIGKVLSWSDAVLSAAIRLDWVDWNQGQFVETGDNIADDLWAITPALTFKPSAETVIRLNYRRQAQRDIFSNPAAQGASWMLGLSTYF